VAVATSDNKLTRQSSMTAYGTIQTLRPRTSNPSCKQLQVLDLSIALIHTRVSIPLAIFSYIGVELLTVTAFEARDPGSLKGPAKHIGYIILAIYLISIGGFVANIEWFNQYLPLFFSQKHVSLDDPSLGHEPRSFPPSPNSSAAPIIAVIQAGIPKLPGVLIGFLVYSGLSAANTALYVASRTLYGLARDLNQMDERRIVRFFAKLNTISSTRHIPVWGLVVSWVMFACWLPFVHLKSNFTQNEVIHFALLNGKYTDLRSCSKLWLRLEVLDVYWSGHHNVLHSFDTIDGKSYPDSLSFYILENMI